MAVERDIPFNPNQVRESLAKMQDEEVRQIVSQANNWADYQRYTGLMNGIANQMRLGVNPDANVPAANADDTNPLKKVEFPPEGGVLTYMENHDHPYRGYPHFEFVDKVDQIKKVNRAVLSGLYHQLKSVSKWKFLTLLPALWLTRHMVRVWVATFHRMVDRFLIKTDKYSLAIRELHRAFSQPKEDELTTEASLREKIRDVVCMILEFDNAYRFRFQDIIENLDKKALEKNTSQELTRLLNIMVTREKTQEIKDTWTLVKNVVRFYMAFDKKLTEMVKNVLLQLDVEKVKLTIEDKEFCLPRKDYTFGFILYPTAEDDAKIKLYETTTAHKETIKRIRTESDDAHQKIRAHYRQVPEDDQKQVAELKQLDEKYELQVRQEVERYQAQKQLITKS